MSLSESQGRTWFIDELPNAIKHGPKGVGKLLSWVSNAVILRDYIEGSIFSERNINEFVLYSYWFTLAPGISLIKERNSSLPVYSRGHGGDIYEERHHPPYLPIKQKMTSLLDKIYLVSTNGKEYLANQTPEYSDKLTVSRLGTLKPLKLCKPSTDGITRLVSCSYMVPVKRLKLLVEVLGYCKANIQWTHIGDGPERHKIEQLVQDLPKNIEVHFTGSLKNEEVMSYYMQNTVDFFINVSSSEGIPVSIMEAYSCSIPAIATDVGGTGELVNSQNGVLVQKDIKPLVLASILDELASRPQGEKLKMREAALETWNKCFNADTNYTKFAKEIGR
ncbi:glycosyltransferase [Mesobacillus persicus]|nr:glycosyltransferase [Mesobacillus persicus]